MLYYKSKKGTRIRIFTLVLIISVASILIVSYYHKVVGERDRLTAKRLEQSISLVLARYVGADLTYENGRICWSKKNADIIKDGIATVIGETKVPVPEEKGCYYYMYLESPYTVIKLPYKTKGSPHIDGQVVTEKYIKEQYPKKEYVQVNEEVPDLMSDYERDKRIVSKNQVVCLNT